MKDETIETVAKILEKWNPLGENANSIKDLDGYRVEAIDIISTLDLLYGNISKRLFQMFLRKRLILVLLAMKLRLKQIKLEMNL